MYFHVCFVGSRHLDISIECRTRRSLKESPKCFDLSASPERPAGSEVMTSNNVVVALTISDDLEGVGLRTGSGENIVSMEMNPVDSSRVAHLVLEREGGGREGVGREGGRGEGRRGEGERGEGGRGDGRKGEGGREEGQGEERGSEMDRVAHITIESLREGGGEGEEERKVKTNVEISIRPDLLENLKVSPDSSP